ncbi:MAG TPA: thiamine pyrophosphate-binding protein [Ktedonobacteraceae bacterium]|nr:thiamine pyrophosphate-binding protein [Ktedonobacteraceae bacterium]
MENSQCLTGAQAIIATLRAHNVDTIFGIPGVHTLPIYDAIYQEPGLRHILARHEQGAGFMAEGYARVSGRPGVVCTISGPGVTNVATPVANAYADSIPLLVISSSLPRATPSRGRGELHEVKNQLGVMESLTGWARAVNAVDVLPTQHPLVLTTNDYLPTELRTLTATSDLVLVVGSKLGAEHTDSGRLPLPTPLIHIDVDPTEIGHNYPATLGIVADACLALEALLELLHDVHRQHCVRRVEIEQVREVLHKSTREANSESFAFLEALYAGLPRDSIVVADMTLLGYACAQYLSVHEPRTFIHPAEFCTIGCALPLALGAKVAAPERPVIALCGDGGFLLNVSELATAAQEKLPVTAVIFNDST